MKVVVVGAGIVGASTAYHLARNNVEVILVDRADEGQATAAGAGIVCPWLFEINPDWFQMSSESARYYTSLVKQLEEEGQEDIGYRQVGALAVSSNPEELDSIERLARKNRESYPEVGKISRLDIGEASKLFPPLADNLAAVHVTGAARVDGRRVCEILQHTAKKYGAIRKTGEAQLIKEESRITGVQVKDERIDADMVIVAAGAWSKALLNPVGIELALEPQRGQIIHLKLQGTDTANWPVVLPQNNYYLLSFDDGRVVVGATREEGTGFDYRVTAAGQQEVLQAGLSVSPGLANSTLYETRVGFRPMGPDRSPLLGTVPNVPGLIIATGTGSSGLTMGPFVGKLAASLAMEEQTHIDLSPYTPLRSQKQYS